MFSDIWASLKATALMYVGRALYSWFKTQFPLEQEDLDVIMLGFQEGLEADIAAEESFGG